MKELILALLSILVSILGWQLVGIIWDGIIERKSGKESEEFIEEIIDRAEGDK